jgi:exopolysaccharide production protein ExoZ
LLLSLQYGRGVAAMMVVFQHAYFQLDDYVPYLHWGSAPAAVDLFFMISGVIMVVTSQRSGPGEFVKRRLVRIVPLYWLFTLMLAGLAVLAPEQLHTTVVTGGTLAKSLLFVPHESLGHPGEIWPILVPGWTLNYEMFFYAVFALLLFLPAGQRLSVATLSFVALVGGGMAFEPVQDPVLRTYTSPLLLDFLVGILMGHLYLARVQISARLAWSLLIIGSMLLACDVLAPISEGGSGFPGFGIAAALLVLGGTQLDRAGLMPPSRLLRGLGDASYSIYLTHLLTLGALRVAWERLGLVNPTARSAHLFALAALTVAAAAGYVSYILLERPMLRLGLRLVGPRPPHARPWKLIPANPGSEPAGVDRPLPPALGSSR